jgi:hypothetical protein
MTDRRHVFRGLLMVDIMVATKARSVRPMHRISFALTQIDSDKTIIRTGGNRLSDFRGAGLARRLTAAYRDDLNSGWRSDAPAADQHFILKSRAKFVA